MLGDEDEALRVNQAEEGAAVGGIDGDEDLICSGGTGNGGPIRAKSGAN